MESRLQINMHLGPSSALRVSDRMEGLRWVFGTASSHHGPDAETATAPDRPLSLWKIWYAFGFEVRLLFKASDALA